nr:LuxR C-terminal-related transcriptional regulator [Bacillus benzoevorans]
MINTIKISRETLHEPNSRLTAQYGIEASLPKAQGTTSDPVLSEVVRRNKYWTSVKKYEKKVMEIQSRIHVITDEREYEVLNWILDGKGYRWIARHMGLSETHIRRIKDSIVDKLIKVSQMSQTA